MRKAAAVLGMMLGVAALGWTGWSGPAGWPVLPWAKAEAKADSKMKSGGDTEQLLQAAGEALGPNAKVKLVLKKSGPYRAALGEGAEALLQEGRLLSGRLGLPPVEALEDGQDRPLYRSAAESGGCARTLLLTMLEDAPYAIVKLECAYVSIDPGFAVALQGAVDRAAEGLHWQAPWNAMVQGEVSQAAGRASEAVTAASARTLAVVEQALDAKAAERYEDAGTVSVSYRSGKLAGSVDSGGSRIGMQAALHRNSQTQALQLTLGAPVITIEY